MGSFTSSLFFLISTALTASPLAVSEVTSIIKSLHDLENLEQNLYSRENPVIAEKFRTAIDEIQKGAPSFVEKVRQYRLMQQNEVLSWTMEWNKKNGLSVDTKTMRSILNMSYFDSVFRIQNKIKLTPVYFGKQLLWNAEVLDNTSESKTIAQNLNSFFIKTDILKQKLAYESFFLLSNSFSETKFDLIEKLQHLRKNLSSSDVLSKEKFNRLLDQLYNFGAHISFSYENNDIILKGVLLGDNPENALNNYKKIRL